MNATTIYLKDAFNMIVAVAPATNTRRIGRQVDALCEQNPDAVWAEARVAGSSRTHNYVIRGGRSVFVGTK